MEIKAVIFDMDGVLVNTPRHALASNNAALSKYGVSLTEDTQKEFQGSSLAGRLPLYEDRFNIKIDFEEFSSTFIKTQLALVEEDITQSADKIQFLLKSLKRQNLKIAVVTSARKEKVLSILTALGIFNMLDALLTADDLTEHKPNPQPYIKILQNLKINPDEAVAIEDSPTGINAAKSAGVKILALKTSEFAVEDLSEADDVIRDINDVLNHI